MHMPEFNNNKKRVYTIYEIQDILGISQSAAYILVKQNLFHTVKVGRHIRVSKESFEKWLTGNDEGGNINEIN